MINKVCHFCLSIIAIYRVLIYGMGGAEGFHVEIYQGGGL